jgi:hypothetical protein
LQLRLAGDQIHRRLESAICAVISNLRRQIYRHPERHAQNIQQPEERMPPQMAENVPAEDAKILRFHDADSAALSAAIRAESILSAARTSGNQPRRPDLAKSLSQARFACFGLNYHRRRIFRYDGGSVATASARNF